MGFYVNQNSSWRSLLAPKCSPAIPAPKGTKNHKLLLNFSVLTSYSIPCGTRRENRLHITISPWRCSRRVWRGSGRGQPCLHFFSRAAGTGAVYAPGGPACCLTLASAERQREIATPRHALSAGVLHRQCNTVFVPLSEHIVIWGSNFHCILWKLERKKT